MKLRKTSPIIFALCTVILGARAAFSQKSFNALGFTEAVPELQGFGGVALLTAVGAVGYGARKVYQKIFGRNRQ